MMITTSNAFAQAKYETINGLRYLLDANTQKATLVANPVEKYSGSITVPEKITATDKKEYTVVALEDYCFSNCSGLNRITLPSSITSLGFACFDQCFDLFEINIPASITSLSGVCFRDCIRLTSLKIPSSVTSLGHACFNGCSSLSDINIPASVTSLGKYCFSGCSSLTNIYIPFSVTSLGAGCFSGCSSFTNINIPSSVTALGEYCFSGCSNLININIPSSITSLGKSCFYGCSSLNTINIPSSITSLGEKCFSECTTLETIKFLGKSPDGLNVSGIPTTCIFYVPTIYLQDYIDAVGKTYSYINAWSEDSENPAHFETIDGLRYLIDSNAKTATLVVNPEKKYSGDIVVPKKLTTKDKKECLVVAFGEGCFSDCKDLTSITIPSSVTSLGKNCFFGCTSLNNVTIPSSVTALGDGCFNGCTSLDNVTIPSSVTALGDGCFAVCTSLTNIIIPSSVTSLGMSCFASCSSLTNITIPSSVTSLGGGCFAVCTSLTNIIIPSSVTSLGMSCFASCSSLTNITIPSLVTSLGENCFGACPKLESIKFLGKTLDGLAISGISPTCIFYVPKAYLEDYIAAIGKTFPYISAWDGSEEKPAERCEAPTITYAAGKLRFKSSTLGADYHYTITDSDMATDAYSQDGSVTLVAAYKISAYATAEGYQSSETATATLYWINANLENDPSTNINQTKTRGIVASSEGGIVTLAGLNNGEMVSFYSLDGRLVATSKAENGTVSCSVNSTMVIAKVGNQSIKLFVKQ